MQSEQMAFNDVFFTLTLYSIHKQRPSVARTQTVIGCLAKQVQDFVKIYTLAEA